MTHDEGTSPVMEIETRILPVDARQIGEATTTTSVPDDILDEFDIRLDPGSKDAEHLKFAAEMLRTSDIPVAFPTETVYGLGADATRSAAVQGIYRAKRRPADNPLIVHFASLVQLRKVLSPSQDSTPGSEATHDPIPAIYRPLISKFWPGPLTIIVPRSTHSLLAPEVTAGLSTFGARIPRHVLALALIKLADRPIAAPSANASTKPSPTAAEHVAHDLQGRIEVILDGGPCDVGVESTVVDGLSSPPLILRPGGIGIEQIRACPGWEATQIGYKNVSELGHQPRAPGMKYRHYSPKATVILFEAGKCKPSTADLSRHLGPSRRVGVVTTETWRITSSGGLPEIQMVAQNVRLDIEHSGECNGNGFTQLFKSNSASRSDALRPVVHRFSQSEEGFEVLEIALGRDTDGIARSIFSALRELDRANVDAIIVEGINEHEGNTAAAIMNRLRKAAEVHVAA